jgi:hypothetical protein
MSNADPDHRFARLSSWLRQATKRVTESGSALEQLAPVQFFDAEVPQENVRGSFIPSLRISELTAYESK